jgi:hypothetical protein
MLPFWFSAMTMKSVGKAALAMVEEVGAGGRARACLFLLRVGCVDARQCESFLGPRAHEDR